MPLQKKKRFRPIFKQFIRLRANIQSYKKLLKLKKNKWKPFLKFYFNKLKNFKKYKSLDQSKYFVTKFGTRDVSYNKRFKNTLQAGKKFRIYYGNLLKKYLKKKIKIVLNKLPSNRKDTVVIEETFLNFFESKLDNVLYRAKFALTVRNARQLILHGKVYVNQKQIKNKAYILQNGDIVNLNFNALNLYEHNTLNSLKWAIPPKHIIINYHILQIIFLGDVKLTSITNEFSFNLKLQKILIKYFRQ